MTQRIMFASLVPVAYQTTALISTATSLSASVRAAEVLHISIETQNARYRADGTAPTATEGVLLTTGNSPYWIEGYNGTSNLKFVAATAGSVLKVMAYKRHNM